MIFNNNSSATVKREGNNRTSYFILYKSKSSQHCNYNNF